MSEPKTFTSVRGMRWKVLGLALAVLVADQWSKFAAVQHLASPAHPMVVRGDGVQSLSDLFAARGLSPEELQAAVAGRLLWRYVRVQGLRADTRLSETSAPAQLLAIADTGLPAPRRLRVMPEDAAGELADVVTRDFGVERNAVDALLNDATFRAAEPALALTEVPATDEVGVLLRRDVEVIAHFMTLVYAENPGAAWGFMRNASPIFRRAFFLCAAALAVLAMIWAVWTGWMGTALGTLALGAVLGGAAGNMIDRALYGVVVDFVLNYVGDFRWPVYNVADIGITLGVGLIVIELLLHRSRDPAPTGAGPDLD